MNKKILFSVSTAVMLLGSIDAHAAQMNVASANASVPLISTTSGTANTVSGHNASVYAKSRVQGNTLSPYIPGDLLNPDNVAAVLGLGADSETGLMEGDCVGGTEYSPPMPTSAVINTSGRYSRRQFIRDFNSSASGGGSWGIFSAKASGGYARFTKSDGLSLTYLYKAEYRLGARMLRNMKLNPQGTALKAEAAWEEVPYQQFRDTCGNKYMRQSNVGGALYFAIKLSFNSYQDKTVTRGSVGGSYFGFKGGGSWTRVSKTLTKGGKMEIRAVQSGGEVLELGTVVGLGNSTSRECDFSNVAECTAFADRLLDYATTNFPAQLARTRNDNAIRTYYSYYRTLGLPANLPYPTGLSADFSTPVWSHRIDVMGMIENNSIRRATAGRLSAYYQANLSNPSVPNANANVRTLETIKTIIENRYGTISVGYSVCWTDPSFCDTGFNIMLQILNVNPLTSPQRTLTPAHLALLAKQV